MITCGIDLKGSSACFVFLQKSKDGIVENITGNFTKLNIEDNENCKQIKSFFDTAKAHFDLVNPDRIGIVKRNTKGKFSGGAVSFKLEGLIQLYDKKNIVLVSPITLRAFQKKHDCGLPQNKYQEKAHLLAMFLLEK